MPTEENENPYEGGTAGLGTGGKFRKRPFRRTYTTPYDRPPTSLRNPTRNNNNGWLSKVVEPAQRLITYSAHSLFSSLFRKRLPPSRSHPSSSETEQEVRDKHQEEATFVATISSGKQQGAVGESDVHINCPDGGGLTELEKLFSQKTFTRSEIDHLTALMRSRIVDAPVREEEKQTEVVPSELTLPFERKEEYPKTPALENGMENRLVLTPPVASSVPIEDVASPAELAKAYMGSRPSKVSSPMLGVQNSALREDPTPLKCENLPFKFPNMSVVPRTIRHAGVHENGFVTPSIRGRSAMYTMARTPYARIYPTSTLKVGGLAVEGQPSSSTQSALDHNMLSGFKTGALKRRSSALDNDIGSVGPIRRIRHKSNLLYSKDSSLPLSGSSISIARSRIGVNAAQQPSSSMQKPILLDELKHSHMKLSEENTPSTSFSPLPSKSSEMASKILQQLDKLVSPKEKSSELRLPTVNDKSPTKLSLSMLHGQALRSMETVDSSKLLDSIKDNRLDSALGNLSANAQKLTSQIDKVENGPLKLLASSDGLVPVVTNADSTKPKNHVTSSAKSVDSFMIKSVPCPPQKKRAFHMSAHEDCLDLDDDDAYANGTLSSISPVEKEMTSSTAMAEKTTSATEAVALENTPPLSVVMPSKSFTIGVEAHVGTADGSRVGEKVDVSTSITSSIPDPSFKPITVAVTAATQSSFGSNKPASLNGSIANPPVFNFGNTVASSIESAATGAPSKDITNSGPIFGLEKVDSSKEPGADASLVNFGTYRNVDKVPQMPFISSSVGGESTFCKFGASDSKLGASTSSATVAGATDSMPKVRESDNAVSNIDSVRSSELAVSSGASSSLLTSPTSIFTFGQSNGSLASSPSFSSPSLVSNNFTNQNVSSSSSLAASSSISATSTPAIIASSNSSASNPLVASSASTTFFKFGSSPVPSTGLPVSSSSSEPQETKSSQDAGNGNLSSTVFGSSSAAVGSTGSGIFGFSSSAMTTVNSQSQGSIGGASNGFATSTQTQSVPFGSSASSASFGLSGNTAFPSGNSLFPSSTPATNTAFLSGSSLFPSSSSATNVFNSGTTFGLGTSASSSAATSVSSISGTNSTLFGPSSWQPSKSPFGSTFSSTSSSSGFSFGTSTAPVTSTSSPSMFSSSPQFSFTSAAATTSTQPAFGSTNSVFTFGSTPVNNDQMSMEDSMAEDTVQATPTATPIFGQQPAPPVQSSFVFGASSTPSGANPFQFGSQQNIAPQNPSPFQASGSLEFNAGGGSFSLGTGGGDKSGRKIVKVKHRQRKK